MVRPMAMLPNILTTLNIACGFWAMTLCLEAVQSGSSAGTEALLSKACWLVVLAAVFDALDGRVARWAKVSSKFGVELDSLADVISFGAAPALIAYTHGLADLGSAGRLAAMTFAVCGALRLARFNVGANEDKPASPYYFQGSPIPAAAGLVVSSVLYGLGSEAPLSPMTLAGLTLYGSAMMVSSFPYPSAKKTPRTKSGRMLQAVALASILFGLRIHGHKFLFACALAYMASGPLFQGYRLLMTVLHGSEPQPEAEEETASAETPQE